MARAYSKNPHTECDSVASNQHGLISRDQAIAYGMTNNTIHYATATGRWIKILPGVYRLAAVAQTWQQEVMAAVVWAGDGAVASHESAAAVLGLDNFKPDKIEISTPRSIRPNGLPIVVHRVKRFGTADRTVHRGIPITSPARLVIDLAGELDLPALVRVIDDCLRRRYFTFIRLRWQVKQAGKKPGVRNLRRVLENPVVPHSVLERKMVELLDSANLPKPAMQLRIKENANLIGQVDFSYPNRKLVIETDGRWFHFGDERFEEDRQRRNALESRGWRVLNFTWRDLIERPDQVVADIARALAL